MRCKWSCFAYSVTLPCLSLQSVTAAHVVHQLRFRGPRSTLRNHVRRATTRLMTDAQCPHVLHCCEAHVRCSVQYVCCTATHRTSVSCLRALGSPAVTPMALRSAAQPRAVPTATSTVCRWEVRFARGVPRLSSLTALGAQTLLYRPSSWDDGKLIR